MLVMTLLWKKSSLLLDLVYSKEKYYKNLNLTQTALDWSTKIVSSNFEYFVSLKEPIFLDFSFLTEGKDKQKINVIISNHENLKTKKEIYLFSQLLDDKNSILCKLSCVLAIDEKLVNQENRDSSRFIIQNYTVSNFI
ncbi:MAG: hypothetical protein ABIA74_01025 [bacterium]